jgi:hypothetical protein
MVSKSGVTIGPPRWGGGHQNGVKQSAGADPASAARALVVMQRHPYQGIQGPVDWCLNINVAKKRSLFYQLLLMFIKLILLKKSSSDFATAKCGLIDQGHCKKKTHLIL